MIHLFALLYRPLAYVGGHNLTAAIDMPVNNICCVNVGTIIQYADWFLFCERFGRSYRRQFESFHALRTPNEFGSTNQRKRLRVFSNVVDEDGTNKFRACQCTSFIGLGAMGKRRRRPKLSVGGYVNPTWYGHQH